MIIVFYTLYSAVFTHCIGHNTIYIIIKQFYIQLYAYSQHYVNIRDSVTHTVTDISGISWKWFITSLVAVLYLQDAATKWGRNIDGVKRNFIVEKVVRLCVRIGNNETFRKYVNVMHLESIIDCGERLDASGQPHHTGRTGFWQIHSDSHRRGWTCHNCLEWYAGTPTV